MGKRLVIYTGAVALTLYCFFMYEDKLLVGLLAAEVIYFVISIAELFVLRKGVSASMGRILPVAEKNQEITVRVTVKNSSRIPAASYRLNLELSNRFTGGKEKYRLIGSTGRGRTEENVFTFRARTCGNTVVELKDIILSDVFGILKIKKRVRIYQKTGILPECHILPLEITRKTREFLADAEEYSDEESGEDPAEVYQIREYRKRDSVHDIHWKLSAKADEFLVKEHGRPIGCVVLIWIDLMRTAAKQRSAGKRTGLSSALMLEAAASLSFSLMEEKCIHMVAWYEKENRRIVKKRISREEHVYELMHRLLFAETYEGSLEADALRGEAFKGENFSTVVELDMDARIFVNEQLEYRLDERKETDWDKVALTV